MHAVRRIAALVSTAVVATSLTVASFPAAAGAAGEPVDQPVETTNVTFDEQRTATTDKTDPAWLDPVVTVPAAGEYEVDVPASGWAKAGSSPVSVGRPSSGIGPSRVKVRVLSQDEVTAVGGKFLGFTVSRADGGSAVGALAVSVDYSGFEKAYGGNFASRLKLVRTDGCARGASCTRPQMTAKNEVASSRMRAMSIPVRPDSSALSLDAENTGTAPAEDSGLGPQAIEPAGDAAMASVDSASSGTTFTLMSTPSGSAGDFGATDFSTADRWSVGVGSGAFTYSYPIEGPPSMNGPSPALALNYSSQSVDGRTVRENGQPSKVGEGWSFEPGFIERRFHPCDDETPDRGDLCWSANNEYFINFMGLSGELVRVSGTSNEWRVRGNDPGWRIVSFTQPVVANGDNDGEHFVVIAPDGTKYWMGYGIEPRSNVDTNSAYTVPVYGGSGEPCYNATPTFAWCNQAYRWNVDRILDRNGVVTSFFYTKEMNKYTRYGGAATDYVRSGYLTTVEYGQRDGYENVTAPGRIRMNTAYRCASQVACSAPTPTSLKSIYPDVPVELMCTASPCDQTVPSFWSTVEIASIQTEFWNEEPTPDVYELVSTYRMTYSFPPTGDISTPSLWLVDITRTGEYGIGSTELPGLRMTGINRNNRVNDNGEGYLPKYRVASISTDLGARINVTYGTPDPCPVYPAFPAWDTNPYDCYPGIYQGAKIPFQKYLVTDLEVQDVRGGGLTKWIHYNYADNAAWHWSDSILTPDSEDTWNDFRGYSDVRVTVDSDPTDPSEGTDTRYLLFRGMYGDKLANGTAKTGITITDSSGAWFNDFAWRRFQTLEVKNVDATDGDFASTLYRYNADLTIDGPNGWETHDSHYVRPTQNLQRVKNLDTNAWRTRQIDSTYSSLTGQRTEWSDYAAAGNANDNTCTKLGITNNIVTGTSGSTASWITAAPYRKIVYGDYCGSGSTNVLEQTQFDYDGHAYQAAPTNQNVTQIRSYDNSTLVATTDMGYDTYGRITAVRSPNEIAAGTNGLVTTTYDPAIGYPYNGVTTTPLAGSVTKTKAYSAFGVPRSVTDVSNGDTTSFAVDHLGRTTSVTRPGDVAGTPSYTFEYQVQAGTPNYVRTNQLLSGTTYVSSWEYVDGFGKTLQTQEPDPAGGTGRRLTTTRYDALGQVWGVSQPFGATGAPGSGLASVAPADIPFETRQGYDSAGRVWRTTQYAAGVTKFATNTNYHGWSHTVDAPVHSDVDYYTNELGQVTSVVERPTSGTITTAYAYTRSGDLETITDASGNLTSYTYDDLRRRTASTDPDQGAWLTTYTAEGDVKTVRDAKNDLVTYDYDRARRKTAVHDGTGTGPVLSSWTYDTASPAINNSVGRLTAATSYSGGSAYTTAITGYDDKGRVTGKRWDIPAAAGALAASYAYTFGYNKRDDLITTDLPPAGGLAAETVTTGFNAAGLPSTLTGLDTYVASTTYAGDGRISARSLVGGVTRSYTYDTIAGRLATIASQAPLAPSGTPGPIENVAYTYDSDSNVTSVTDALAGAGGVAQRECYSYDPLNRLTAAYTTNATACGSGHVSFGADPYSATYAYNNLGDLTSTTMNGVTSAYTYGVAGHAHAANTIGGALYEYDANGATTTRPTPGGPQGLDWDRLHRLTSVSGPGASSFIYDADGNRLLRTAGNTTTLYLDGTELTATVTANGTTVTGTRYYGGFAMRAAGVVSVLLHNRQNSTTGAYNTTADNVTHQRYTPYGSRRGAVPLGETERRFLDKTEDATGLITMGARYYDPSSARFVSVDPLADLTRPQSLAAYSYTQGNPTTFTDPSGLNRIEPIDWDLGPTGSGGNTEPTPNPTAQTSPAPPTPEPADPNPGATNYTYTPGYTVCTAPSPGLAASCGAVPAQIHGPGPGVGDLLYGMFVAPFKNSWKNGKSCFNEGDASCFSLWWNLVEIGLTILPMIKAGIVASRAAKASMAARQLRRAEEVTVAIRTTLDGLPKGFTAGVRLADESSVVTMFREWSAGGKSVTSSYPGTLVELPNGTRLGLRTTSRSGGTTVDIWFTDKTSAKIHVK